MPEAVAPAEVEEMAFDVRPVGEGLTVTLAMAAAVAAEVAGGGGATPGVLARMARTSLAVVAAMAGRAAEKVYAAAEMR